MDVQRRKRRPQAIQSTPFGDMPLEAAAEPVTPDEVIGSYLLRVEAEDEQRPPVQLQDGPAPEWTCPNCGGDLLFCVCKGWRAIAREGREHRGESVPSEASSSEPTVLELQHVDADGVTTACELPGPSLSEVLPPMGEGGIPPPPECAEECAGSFAYGFSLGAAALLLGVALVIIIVEMLQ